MGFIAYVFAVVGIGIVLLMKSENAYRNQMKILDAIYDYASECIWTHKPILVVFDEMEPLERTLFRFWDWGYTRILPAEKFEIIQPYIKKGR